MVPRLAGFAWRVLGEFRRNRGFLLAGALGYNTLLSIVPLFALVAVALSSVLDLDGGSSIGLPAQANVKRDDGTASTAVVVQHPEDGVEDGHEAAFQDEGPKHQYRCFLQSLTKGTPSVPDSKTPDGTCD